jgi:hypothetical protein
VTAQPAVKTATLSWLGKPPSSQIPVEDRD